MRYSVSVEPRLRTAVNVNRIDPRRIELPSPSRVTASTRASALEEVLQQYVFLFTANVGSPITDSNIVMTPQDIQDIIAFLKLL